MFGYGFVPTLAILFRLLVPIAFVLVVVAVAVSSRRNARSERSGGRQPKQPKPRRSRPERSAEQMLRQYQSRGDELLLNGEPYRADKHK